jgi:AcrR family transcriptional regulator
MGTTERREREKAQRREGILDAAEKVFFTKGMKEATMDEIAEVAELSKGTLYLYFRSKEDIYFGINRRALGILREMFEDAIASQATGAEKMREIGRAYYSFSQTYPDYFEAMMYFDAEVMAPEDAGQIGLECHEEGMRVLGLVAESVRLGAEDGSLRSDLDPMKTAILLWGQTDGVIRVVVRKCQHMKDLEGLDPEKLIEEFFMFIYGAMRPPGAGPMSGEESEPKVVDEPGSGEGDPR